MDDQERQEQELKQRDLLHVHKERLHYLELQQGKFGNHTPVHIVAEIVEIQKSITQLEAALGINLVKANPASLREMKSKALKAYHTKNFAQAEEILSQLVLIVPKDDDLKQKLVEVQENLEKLSAYKTVQEIQAVGNWQGVLAAIADLGSLAESDELVEWLEPISAWANLHSRYEADCNDAIKTLRLSDFKENDSISPQFESWLNDMPIEEYSDRDKVLESLPGKQSVSRVNSWFNGFNRDYNDRRELLIRSAKESAENKSVVFRHWKSSLRDDDVIILTLLGKGCSFAEISQYLGMKWNDEAIAKRLGNIYGDGLASIRKNDNHKTTIAVGGFAAKMLVNRASELLKQSKKKE